MLAFNKETFRSVYKDTLKAIYKNMLRAVLLSVLLLPGLTWAKTKTTLWLAADPVSVQVVDHHRWQDFLNDYLVESNDGIYRVDYQRVTSLDKKKLDSYIDSLVSITVAKLNRLEQLAYWINLYNALTVQLILDHYPVASIKAIKSSLFSFGPWDKLLVTVAGNKLSLNDIEHQIIRPIFSDNRIHYAVNCASLGCPNLASTAYSGAQINQQLAKAKCEFIRHPRGVRIQDKQLVLSSIYKWYAEDFGRDKQALLSHFDECYSEQEPKISDRFIKEKLKIKYQYDWNLNTVE